MSFNWTPLPWAEAQRRRRAFNVQALEDCYHQAATSYETYHASPSILRELAMTNSVTRYLETASDMKNFYWGLPWNLFGVRYIFSLFRIHIYFLLLVLLTANGVVDSYLESFPKSVYKPWDVRHLDCAVRTIDTVLVIALWYFPNKRGYIELGGGTFAIAASIIRSWRISVGTETPITTPLDWYNLVALAVTAACKLLILLMALPMVNLTVLDPFKELFKVGRVLTGQERQTLLLALLQRKISVRFYRTPADARRAYTAVNSLSDP